MLVQSKSFLPSSCDDVLICEETHVECTYGNDFIFIADTDKKTGKLVGNILEIIEHVELDRYDTETIMTMLREKYLARNEMASKQSEEVRCNASKV